ncbi:hypothetical protein DXG01_012990, partial [Tephrocybe rancida]
MSARRKAKVTKNARGEGWARVTFRPDLARLALDKIDGDTAGLFGKRVFWHSWYRQRHQGLPQRRTPQDQELQAK